MTMVDRVAKAICADSATLDWREYRDEARRAIAAMREPTGDILFAMAGAEDEQGRRHYERDSPYWDGIWRAGVDAALSEEP
jgi:hypothetical protein